MSNAVGKGTGEQRPLDRPGAASRGRDPVRRRARDQTVARISGQQISGDATAQIEVANGRARVKVTDLGSTAVQLPDAIKRRLTDALTTDLELPTLPYQLTLRTVRIAPDGLHVAATATNVPIAR